MSFDITQWSRVQHADGTIVLTAPPVHPAFAKQRHAALRIRHDAALASLDTVCQQLAVANSRIDGVESTERIVTRSGEFGAFRHLRITIGSEALRWAIGIVAGDQMTIVDGIARSPNIALLVRDVLVDTWIGAYDRIRMVPYRAPVGWFGVRRTFATCWLAPDSRAQIIVGDAVPRGPAERTHALQWPFANATVVTREDARWVVRSAVVDGIERDVALLHELVQTIELPPAPLPAAPMHELDWMVT